MPDRIGYWCGWLKPKALALCLQCIFFPVSTIAQSSFWLHLADEIHPDAQLAELKDAEFTFRTEEAEIESESVVRWGSWPGIVGQQAIWLSDGSWLAGQILSIDEKSISLQNRWLKLSAIPQNAVRAVIYSPVASLHEWTVLADQLTELKGESDTVWLLDGNRLSGVLDLTPTGEPSAPAFTLEVGRDRLTIPWSRVETLAASPALVGPLILDRKATTFGLEDGSRLFVTGRNCLPKRVELQIRALGEIASFDAPEEFARAIRLLECDDVAQVKRIDSLQPTSYRFLPDHELTFELGKNRSVFDRPLIVGHRLEAGVVTRGLAMHSSSQVAFRWDQSPGKFLAEACWAGLPDSEQAFGDANCKVLIGKGRDLATVAEFELSTRSQPKAHHPVEVDITGAQLVVLVVEKARFGQWGDQVYWLDARFFKEPL